MVATAGGRQVGGGKSCEISDLTFGRSNRSAGMDGWGVTGPKSLVNARLTGQNLGWEVCRWAGIDTESSVLTCSAKGERARALAPALTDCVASTTKFCFRLAKIKCSDPKQLTKSSTTAGRGS